LNFEALTTLAAALGAPESLGPPIAGAAIATAAIRASAIVTWLHLTLPFF
jgi:hypothetical protein